MNTARMFGETNLEEDKFIQPYKIVRFPREL